MDVTHAPPEEAVGLAVDSYIAALTDDQVDALLARTRAPKESRYPAKPRTSKRRNTSRE
jgi:hypothetical protein